MEMDGEDGPDPSSARFPLPPRSYPEMILEAIDALRDDNASNEWAISGYIRGRYGAGLPRKHLSVVRSHLARMVCAGEILLDKNKNNCYRRHPDPADPVKRGRRRRRRKPKGPGSEVIIGAMVTPSEAFVVGPVKVGRRGKAPVAVGTRRTVPLPTYPESFIKYSMAVIEQMIVDAIQALGNENGSDSAAIAGYIEAKYGAKLTRRHRHATFVSGELSLMKATGEVLSVSPTH
uniref:H15 domain-containing protein n=1 Tax=Setaria italica TaxID=4555 RepID=K3YDR1_SETIT